MKIDSEETIQYKSFLLWSVYYLDKSLSLRLGRASTIPDSDITIPRPSTGSRNNAPVMAYFPLWIESARCQGSIYEMLYSPSSLIQPDTVRYDRAQSLVTDLQALDQATRDTNVSLAWTDRRCILRFHRNNGSKLPSRTQEKC